MARAARGGISRVYLHWTAGRYGECFDEYHVNVGGEGEVFLTCGALTETKAHTWRRNTGAVGIALCCAYGAQCGAGGEPVYPQGFAPTRAQVEALALVVAVLCAALGLAIEPQVVATHCEVATRDGYGPGSGDADTRWDLSFLPDSQGILRPGGEYIRELARGFPAAVPIC